MKIANFITHILLFLGAWCLSTVAVWGKAQSLATASLTPWIVPAIASTESQVSVAFAAAAAIAVIGSLLVAVIFMALLMALESLAHYLRKAWTTRPR